MRTLPESASLDHLRKQAKDLLDVLRRSDPSTTLSDAQANLARQYGYATWTELKKASDEQNALPPVVADQSVVDAVVECFALGSATSPLVRVDRTWSGDTWEMETPAGRVVLTQLKSHLDPTSIELQSGLVEQAIAHGVPTAAPIRTTDGPFVTEIGGDNWRAHRWLRLGPMTLRPAPVEVAALAAKALGTLHAMAVPAPGPVSAWLTHRSSHGEGVDALVAQVERERPEWNEPFRQALEGFLEFEPLLDASDQNARAIFSHSWIAPESVRVGGADGIVLTVWEHAGPVAPDLELGHCLISWAETGDNEFVAGPAQAFLDSYRTTTNFDGAITLPMLTYGISGAINWLVSRINIALNDCDAAERELAERMVPGLLAKPVSPRQMQAFVDSLR
jgi:phosphotransferase family enzyme